MKTNVEMHNYQFVFAADYGDYQYRLVFQAEGHVRNGNMVHLYYRDRVMVSVCLDTVRNWTRDGDEQD